MPREPLREEQVLGRSIDVGDRCVAKRVKGVETIEAGLDLEFAEENLDAALRKSPSGWERREERSRRAARPASACNSRIA